LRDALLSRCKVAIRRVWETAETVGRSRMAVIDPHFLLRRPLTFSRGEESSVHSSNFSTSRGL
jgi:hypothetical protein